MRTYSEWNQRVAEYASTGTVACPDCGELLPVNDDAARQAHYQKCGIALTEAEEKRLAELEVTIESGLKVFFEVGTALLEVRDNRLYRKSYQRFEDYCRVRWQMTRQYANRLIAASAVIENLETSVSKDDLPQHEKHVRPLTSLAPEEQVLVWQVIEETAPGGKVTEAHVRSVVTVMKEVTATGAIDNGDGEQIPVAQATTAHVKAAVTEETYERLKRQETYVSEKLEKKKRLGATKTPVVLSDLDADKRQAFDRWLACQAAEMPDGIEPPAVNDAEIFNNFEQRIYSVWNFGKATNEIQHFGNIPPEIIDNLLYYYTRPFDVVFDPFGGGGSTIDKCRERQRRYYVSDLTPPPARAHDMRSHDITTGLPDDLPVPDLVFLDPPYWKQAANKYSNKPTDLANMPLDAFIEAIGCIAQRVAALWTNRPTARLALIIGTYKEDSAYTDLPFLCYQAIQPHLRLIQRIQVPYSTQVHGGAYVARAKEQKEILYLSRDLMIFGV